MLLQRLTAPRPGLLPARSSRVLQCRDGVAVHASFNARTSVQRRPASGPATSRRRGRMQVRAMAAVEDIQVVSESPSAAKRRLAVTVPGSFCQKCFEEATRKLRDVVGDVQGFRRDKLPLQLITQHVGGQKNLRMMVIEEILMTAMPKVMGQFKDVVYDSERIVTDVRDMERGFDPAQPLAFTVEYETVPPLRWTRSYRDMAVSIRDTGNLETDKAAVEALIKQYLKKGAYQRVAAGRGLQMGDAASITVDVVSKASRRSLPGMKRSRIGFDTEAPDPLGLAKGMAGMTPGQASSFDITFPQDYPVDIWQGMQATVNVKLHELFEWDLPAFSDEWVKKNYPQFSGMQDMRDSLLKATAMERLRDLDMRLEEAIYEALGACLEVEVLPEKLVEDMGINWFRSSLMKAVEKKVIDMDGMKALTTEAMCQEYMAAKRKELQAAVKFNLAVDHIFEQEKLKLDEKDVAAEIEQRKAQFKAEKMDYSPEMVESEVRETFKTVVVMEWLKDTVKRTVEPYVA